MTSTPPGHDIVVVGASAGGVDALTRLVAGLPADLPAAVFVALHMAPGFGTTLPELLSRRSGLRAALALHGEAIVPGRIYVAPPDNHLAVQQGYVHVTRGPKENGHRPSIDTLFRSASKAYGPRVIAAVLTGYLDCGTAGLMSVKARGGIAIAQDPMEAFASDMPRSAIEHVAVDHVARLDDLGPLIGRLVAQPPGRVPAHLPRALAELEGEEPGAAADLACPDCDGVLTETALNGFHRFRCHVGHAYSLQSIAAAQAEQLERALWSAIRALEESAALAGRIFRSTGTAVRSRFADKQETQTNYAALIRNALLAGMTLTRQDASGEAEASEGWSDRPADPPSTRGHAMSDQNNWKGDAVADAPPGESEAGADRVAGREAAVHPRESPPPNPGRFQPRKLTPEDDREIQKEKQQEAIERHAEDRETGNGTAPKNM